MPTEKVLLQWAEQVPNTFTFVLKASRRITHLKRLSGVDEEMDYVLRTASVLGNNLGALLFQLPPNFKKDLAKLAAFFTLLPKKGRVAMEFRNQTWFDDAVYDALRERNVALVVAETDEGGETPLVRTADWGYLRLRSQQYQQRTASVLGNNLGALLFQLPPNFKKDLAKLAAFFTLLPKKGRVAMEFRNQTWFDDAVYDALRERNVALVVAETDEGGETPLVRTADWGYLRLRSQQYQQEDLRAWADRVREQQWNDAFVFFKHEDEATGPLFAAQFDKIYGS